MEFLTQRREGAKIVNSLTSRLCVSFFPNFLHTRFFTKARSVKFTEKSLHLRLKIQQLKNVTQEKYCLLMSLGFEQNRLGLVAQWQSRCLLSTHAWVRVPPFPLEMEWILRIDLKIEFSRFAFRVWWMHDCLQNSWAGFDSLERYFCWLPNVDDSTWLAVNMIARSSNGRTRHSECRCVGSNPALAA